MKIYVGDSKLVKIDKRRCERLDDGKTSTNEVYRNGKDVYKFFHTHLDEGRSFTINKNQYFLDFNMDLKVIRMLDALIYNSSKKCIGTHTTYVDGISELNKIIPCLLEMKKNQFLESFYLLEKDLDVLTKNKIAVYDLLPYNSILKKGILYHIDYGYFEKCDNPNKNISLMDEYIGELLDNIYEYLGYNIHTSELIPNYLFDYLKKDMNEGETVKEFVKKII